MSEALREELEQNQDAPQQETNMPSLTWHRFLVRFLLFLLPACALFQIWGIATGRIYHSMAARDAIYAGIRGMRALDLGLCLLLLGEAVLLLLARGKLKRLSREGARLLLTGHGLAVLTWMLYGLSRLLIAGLSPLSISVAGQCATNLILLLVNRCYYARRDGVWMDCVEGSKQ